MQNYYKYLKLFGFRYGNYQYLAKRYSFDYDELNSNILQCSLCSLSLYSKSKNINTKNSNIIFVLEHFFAHNTPFLPNEEIVFNKMITNVLKLDNEQYIILPIIKCNVFSNISDESYQICKEYIFNEFKLLNPKLIITFGSSFNKLFNKDYQKVRGNLIQYDRLNIVPIYDIGFLIKNPTFKQTMYKDLQKIKYLIDKL